MQSNSSSWQRSASINARQEGRIVIMTDHHIVRRADGRVCCAGQHLCSVCEKKAGPATIVTADAVRAYLATAAAGVPPPPSLFDHLRAAISDRPLTPAARLFAMLPRAPLPTDASPDLRAAHRRAYDAARAGVPAPPDLHAAITAARGAVR